MINGHIEGVIELALDGHTNICGTNASGKTTLQRLIPVFYGELPNNVVPKTRKKFDQFYLPHGNSYLIYEYRREAGTLCHVVLTGRKGEGVSYRFVNAPYSAALYLDEQGQAHSYQAFSAGLRQQGIDQSARIESTSQYRSIIQNDFSLLAGSLARAESNRLRQAALRYSLVENPHRLRHMEKLVSAVHAKEGKMDTLKTMLAAIFEDEGVALPKTTVKGAQVRDWVQRVRQSRRLSSLKNDLSAIAGQVERLNATEESLWQLQPQLLHDASQLERDSADEQALILSAKRALALQEDAYESQRRILDDQRGKNNSELDRVQAQLNDIELRHAHFMQADMHSLENAVKQLPEWRSERDQLAQHLQLLREAEGSSRQKFESRKLELSEQLNAFVQRISQQQQALRDDEHRLRGQHTQQQRELEQAHQQQQQALNNDYQDKHMRVIEQQAEVKANLTAALISVDEQQTLETEQGRIDDVQLLLSNQNETLERLRDDYERSKTQQDQHLERISAQHKSVRAAEQLYQQLKLQQAPQVGSLRHFLQAQVPGWQHTLGKVIREDLLERSDLAPTLQAPPPGQAAPLAQASALDAAQQLFNLRLDLSAIELPGYAQDEQALLAAIEQALTEVRAAEQQLAQLNSEQKSFNQQVQAQQDLLHKARHLRERYSSDLTYAREARQRLQENLQQLQHERKQALQQRQQALTEQLTALKQQQKKALQERDSGFQEMLLEYQADWQQGLQVLVEQIAQHQHSISAKRRETEQQVQELQSALEQELREEGIDPQKLKETEQRLTAMQQKVNSTEERRDELDDYRTFMRIDWQQLKPQMLAQEHQLKQHKNQLDEQLSAHKNAFSEQHQAARAAIKNRETQLESLRKLAEQVLPLLTALEQFVPPSESLETQSNTGDCTERIERARRALQEKQQLNIGLRNSMQAFERELLKDAAADFVELWSTQQRDLGLNVSAQQSLAAYQDMLHILQDLQLNLAAQGRTYGDELRKFFDVFSDLNQRIQLQGRRLSAEVTEEFVLQGISKSEVRIQSSIDELSFWQPLKHFSKQHAQWALDAEQLPSDSYLDALSDVAELLRSDQQFTFESLLRLELRLNEGGTDLIIRNDRQLLESSSHGMAYLILCKYLLAFTRLLRGKAQVTIHWPIDEIGTLAYHNVEKLFKACENNNIFIVGAFPNPESDVLTLFKNRYLIEKSTGKNAKSKLKRIEPELSRLSQRLLQRREENAQ